MFCLPKLRTLIELFDCLETMPLLCLLMLITVAVRV